jgi:putative transposase
LAGRRTKAEVAEYFGISRKSVYKWMERYQAHGREGLIDLSRVPHHLARAIAPRVAEEIVRLRLEQPLEGPLKIQAPLTQLPQLEGSDLGKSGTFSRKSPLHFYIWR